MHRKEVFRRILPIRDVVVRPARHFVISPHDGKVIEVNRPPAYTRTVGSHDGLQWSASEPMVMTPSNSHEPSSRSEHGRPSRDQPEATAPHEVNRKTTVHHYPAEVDTEARIRGLTQPVEVVTRPTEVASQPVPTDSKVDAEQRVKMPRIRRSTTSESLADLHAEANRPEAQCAARERRTRFKEPLHEVLPCEFPRRAEPVSKDEEVTPWEFALQKKPGSDPVARGGHSIASATGRELLRRRASSKSSVGRES